MSQNPDECHIGHHQVNNLAVTWLWLCLSAAGRIIPLPDYKCHPSLGDFTFRRHLPSSCSANHVTSAVNMQTAKSFWVCCFCVCPINRCSSPSCPATAASVFYQYWSVGEGSRSMGLVLSLWRSLHILKHWGELFDLKWCESFSSDYNHPD